MKLTPSQKLKQQIPDAVDFLNKVNFDYCVQRYDGLTSVEEALNKNVIKLREIGIAYGVKTPKLLISAWLTMLCDYFAFDVDKRQIQETAGYIYEEAHFLNLAELTLVFKRIKKGHYGEFYGRFNPQTIIKAIKAYRSERGAILSRQPTIDFDEIAERIKKGLNENNK